MSRFNAPDLSRLNAPSAIEVLDVEGIVTGRLDRYQDLSDERGVPFRVARLESDPTVINQEVSAYFELIMRGRVNQAVRDVMLVTAEGDMLDHIAATYYGISRRVVTEATENTPAVLEDDITFRYRIALAPEAWSTAGPEGAYIFHAIEDLGIVRDVAVYSEEDSAVYADSTPVLAPEVLIVVLSEVGNGVPTQETMNAVLVSVSAEDVRPIGDKVTIEPATVVEYSVVATLSYSEGADPAVVRAAAIERVSQYVAERWRIGLVAQRLGIGAALKVDNVAEIAISEPAEDIDPGSKGAAHCISVTVNTVPAEESWR